MSVDTETKKPSGRYLGSVKVDVYRDDARSEFNSVITTEGADDLRLMSDLMSEKEVAFTKAIKAEVVKTVISLFAFIRNPDLIK